VLQIKLKEPSIVFYSKVSGKNIPSLLGNFYSSPCNYISQRATLQHHIYFFLFIFPYWILVVSHLTAPVSTGRRVRCVGREGLEI
jgi:hypothetical protein